MLTTSGPVNYEKWYCPVGRLGSRRSSNSLTTSRASLVGPCCPRSRISHGLCVPITSSTSCHQVIFVDHATDLSSSSDAVQVEIEPARVAVLASIHRVNSGDRFCGLSRMG